MFEDTTKQLRHKALQEAMLGIRAKYGKNSILKGMNFEEAATGRERNDQIGGHKK
jgi:DNA polymerase V